MLVRKKDTVMVITGKNKGKSGQVIRVIPEKNKVFVQKVNMIKRHTRPTQKSPQGGIVEKEGPIHVSNLKIVCPKCSKAVRVRMNHLDSGKKVRACRLCDEILDAE